jgi:hypothetical protein
MPRYRLGSVVATAVFAALLMAAPAMAASVNDIFNDYQKNGQINACKYSPSDLQRAGSQLPSDVEQYSPSFADQLNAARGRQCGSGGGSSSGQSTSVGAPVSGGGGGAGGGAGAGKVSAPPVPDKPARLTLGSVPAPQVNTAAASSSTSAGRPDSVIVLLIAAAGLVLIGALVARRLGFHPIQKIRGTGPPLPGASGH